MKERKQGNTKMRKKRHMECPTNAHTGKKWRSRVIVVRDAVKERKEHKETEKTASLYHYQ
jgi:hypothetical protein